jgi:hypothetical protein
VKEDLSDIWKEEDPDYKYPGKSMAEEPPELALSWEFRFFDGILPCGLETGPGPMMVPSLRLRYLRMRRRGG